MMKLTRKFHEWNLNRKQADVKQQMDKYGLSEELLEKQFEINKKRHELDIPDKKELIYDEFVQ